MICIERAFGAVYVYLPFLALLQCTATVIDTQWKRFRSLCLLHASRRSCLLLLSVIEVLLVMLVQREGVAEALRAHGAWVDVCGRLRGRTSRRRGSSIPVARA